MFRMELMRNYHSAKDLMMDKDKLIQYQSKKEEIAELNAKLKELQSGKTDEIYCSDVINDYRKGYGQPQAITGIDYQRISSLRSRYVTSIMRIQAECEEVEEYVETIKDSLTRRIIRMYYLEGMKQQQIARAIHLDQSAVSKKIRKFMSS